MNNFEVMKFEISKIKCVEHVDILLNDTVYFDHQTQLPIYSFRVIVVGDKLKLKKIAKIVWSYKPIGALTMGNTAVKFKDKLGFQNIVKLEVV